MFRNSYWYQKCGHEWIGLWEGRVDGGHPVCSAHHMSPFKSQDTEDE